MSKRVVYANVPIGKLRAIRDFLPAPEELAFREEGVKVTLALSKRSVEFFKREARRHNTQSWGTLANGATWRSATLRIRRAFRPDARP
jgi:hypothetical protein